MAAVIFAGYVVALVVAAILLIRFVSPQIRQCDEDRNRRPPRLPRV